MSQNEIPDGDRKLEVLVSKSCPHCKVLEEVFKDDIVSGKVRFIDVASDEGRNIMSLLDIRAVPTFIGLIVKVAEQISYICKLNNDMTMEKCVELKNEKK